MGTEVLFLVSEDTAEGGFLAAAPAAGIYTQADDWESLKAVVADAVRCHFDQADLPVHISLHLVVKDEEFVLK